MDLTNRIEKINNVLQEKITDEKVLLKQKEELEKDIKELKEKTLDDLGIPIDKIPDLLKELEVDIESRVISLEKTLKITD